MSTNPETTKPAGVIYDMDGRTITREDARVNAAREAIATLDEQNAVQWLKPEYAAFRPPVTRFLKSRGIDPTFPDVAPPPDKPGTNDPAPQAPRARFAKHLNPEKHSGGLPVEDNGPDGMRGLPVEVRKAVNNLRAKEGFPLGEVEPNAPPMPKKTSGAGDKAPAIVTWYLRYFPKLFAEKYGVIGIGSIEKTRLVIDPETKRKKRERYREQGHVIAKRATIYTEVVRNAADVEGGDE